MIDYAFIGARGSGKSTAANILVGRGYVRHALAGPLKTGLGHMAHLLFDVKPLTSYRSRSETDRAVRRILRGEMGFPDGRRDYFCPVHYERDRQLRDYYEDWINARKAYTRQSMQYVGSEFVRCLGADEFDYIPWPEVFAREVETTHRILDRAVVTDDVRFADEIATSRDLGFTIVRVLRPDTEAVDAHMSEQGWRQFPADIEITNTDIDRYRTAIERL